MKKKTKEKINTRWDVEYIKYAMVINRKKIRNKNEERILKMKIRKTNE